MSHLLGKQSRRSRAALLVMALGVPVLGGCRGQTSTEPPIVPRLRKYTTRMASPIAASAAATVSTSMAKTWPTTLPWNTENATRLMFTASSISSTHIRMTMTFLRLRKMPNTPSVNSTEASAR